MTERTGPFEFQVCSHRLSMEIASECLPDNDRTHTHPPDMGPFKLL